MSLTESPRVDGATTTAAPPLVPRPAGQSRVPFSLTQQRLWVVQQLDSNSAAYNSCRAFRVEGSLDREVLEACVQAIVNRHEALRTVFTRAEGEPAQQILELVPFTLGEEDLSDVPPEEREATALEMAALEACESFDLERGPLLRVKYYACGENVGVLGLSFHHIVFDARSMQVFMDELSALYDGFCRDALPDLPDLPVQYPDYALWQRQRWRDEALDREVEHWRSRLADVPTLLEVNPDRPRPPVQTSAGGAVRFDLGALAPLRAAARRAGATPFMTAFAAFYAWIYRCTDQGDLVVGVPVANRNRRELESLIGFFVNTLAVRVGVEAGESFETLVRNVRAVCTDAYEHEELPFERLVEALRVPRTLSQAPLVQVAFSFQRMPVPRTMGGVLLEPVDLDTGTAKFDLALSLWHDDERVVGRFEYSSDLYEQATVEAMARQYSTLFQDALADPSRRISELALLTEDERERMLVQWNDTSADYPRDRCVHHLFEAQADRAPDAPALEYGDEVTSYSALRARARQLAGELRRAGVVRGDRVGVCLEQSPELIIAILAVLEAGAAYVPLDPTYPEQRRAFMMSDSGARAIVTESNLAGALSPLGLPLVYVDVRELARGAAEPYGDTGGDAGDAAYVMYTSGSTGQPKGVVIPHRAINRLVLNTDYVQLGPEDRLAQSSNIAFDASTFEIWGALLNGGCVVGVEKRTLLAPQELEDDLRKRRISTMFLTTALFNQIALDRPAAFSPLRYVLFGGEAVDPRPVREVLQAGPPGRLLHVYGPTECTTFASSYHIERVAANAATIPIGRPIANTRAYVLDRRQQPVPVGVPGELYLGGDGLAVGYLGNDELTRARFVRDPFSTGPGERLYRTGDVVRYRDDGAIEFVGRRDNQLKIRGFRVELGEIEAALITAPGVANAAVIATGTSAEKRLVAFVVPGKEADLDTAVVRNHLRARLPDYMVPTAWVTLDALPLNPNGKVDRSALRPPPPERPGRDSGATRPLTGDQRRLLMLWREVLGIETIGIRDDFFELGGHSLLALRLLASIEKTFYKRVPVATFFAGPNIEALAKYLWHAPEVPRSPRLLTLQSRGKRPAFFCVPGAGTGMAMKELADHLGEDQPFYAFQPQGIDDGRLPQLRVEDMAAYYLDALRTQQPSGPYFLGGRCFGGFVAFEMARQLKAAGEDVRLLAVIDMLWPPARENARARRPKPAPAERAAKARRLPERYRPLFEAQEEARDYYVAHYYPGRVTLFCNEKINHWARVRWSQLAEAVDFRFVPGDHLTMMKEPHVTVLATALAEAIAQAGP